MHPAMAFLRDHAQLQPGGKQEQQQPPGQQQQPGGEQQSGGEQPPREQQQQQQQQQQGSPGGADVAGTGQQPVINPLPTHSRPKAPGGQRQQQPGGAVPPKAGGGTGPEEQLTLDVGADGLRFGSSMQMQGAIKLAVGAGCIVVLAIIVVRHGQHGSSGLMSSIAAISTRARLGTRWER